MDLKQAILRVADDLQIPVDADLTDVTCRTDGTVAITTTVDGFPDTDIQRDMWMSSLHLEILHEFQNVCNIADVQVIVPQCTDSYPHKPRLITPTDWIQEQLGGVREYIVTSAMMMVQAAYRRTIDAYPWRNKDGMRARLPELVAVARTNILHGRMSPIVTQGNVDDILVPMEGILSQADVACVWNDTTALLGGVRPRNLLLCYETLFYGVAHGASLSRAAQVLFHCLFCV